MKSSTIIIVVLCIAGLGIGSYLLLGRRGADKRSGRKRPAQTDMDGSAMGGGPVLAEGAPPPPPGEWGPGKAADTRTYYTDRRGPGAFGSDRVVGSQPPAPSMGPPPPPPRIGIAKPKLRGAF